MTAVDPRLYILGGLLLLAIVLLLYLLKALLRYRSAVRMAGRAVGASVVARGVESPERAASQPADDVFAAGSAAVSDALAAPLRTGAWRPDEPEPAPAAPAPTLSIGSVLSAASSMLPAAEADSQEYLLVAPVELHFTLGEGRVGVKPGTRTFVEFQRLAGVLMYDLRSSGGRRRS